jgi:stalled ribosome alternative rescue factor ArfA
MKKRRRPPPKKRSPAAKLVQEYPHIVEKPRKGKGSYVREKTIKDLHDD